MRNIRIAVLIVVAILFAGMVVIPNVVQLTAANDDIAQDAQNRREIEALMWKYARALDTYNPEAYASCYTPDGQFGAGENATKGAAALTKMVEGLKKTHDEREKTEPQPSGA